LMMFDIPLWIISDHKSIWIHKLHYYHYCTVHFLLEENHVRNNISLTRMNPLVLYSVIHEAYVTSSLSPSVNARPCLYEWIVQYKLLVIPNLKLNRVSP
jgi:hypothetical protein